MEIGIGVAVGLVLAVLGYLVGRSGGRTAGRGEGRREAHDEGRRAGLDEARAEAERRVRAVAEAVSRGRRPEGGEPGSPEAELQRALEKGWTPKEKEREAALREAVGRVAAFLDKAVRAPLADASPSADAAELRERIDRALGSLQDLEFFIAEAPGDAEGRDLSQLVQQVTREFALDQAVAIRLRLDSQPVRARVNAQTFMDALYLVLHNAARFGNGQTVDVVALRDEGRSVIRIRDRGPGFTEEAFDRAFDPFYSTADDGLGLGLPHVRKVVEGMGGTISLRNVPDGGAEVEVSFPAL